MARTIGKKNINLVKRLVKEEIKKATSEFGVTQYSGIESQVVHRLPESLWDTWESADAEIRRIINDEVCEYSYRGKEA